MDNKKPFDVIVVGGGPAGIMAALHASRGGSTVCMIDRKKEIGTPVRCGEAIGIKGFQKSNYPMKSEWIRSTITQLQLVSPSEIRVELPAGFNAHIVDRRRMEHDMTLEAIRSGTTFLPDTTVIAANKNEDACYECTTTRGPLYSRSLILADGVESKLARDFGWATSLKRRDIHSTTFATVSGISVKPDTSILYYGRAVAPGGFVWVFPRGSDSANIGLGVNGMFADAGTAQELLKRFIATRYPRAHVADVHSGGVPMNRWLRPLVKDGVMVVGDAARMMNCTTGAGINYSLFSGQVAGTIAAQALQGASCRYDHLKMYEKEWARQFGAQQVRSYALKEAMINFSDAFMDKVASAFAAGNSRNTSVLKVFLKAFSHHPVMMFKVFMLYKP